jgi:Beta-lactamase enzyme family
MKTKFKRKRILFILVGIISFITGGMLMHFLSSSSDRGNNIIPNSNSNPDPVQFPATVSQPTIPASPPNQVVPSPQTGNVSSSSILRLSNQPTAVPDWFKQQSLAMPSRNEAKWGQSIAYTPIQPPQFVRDSQLQSVVEDILKLVKSKSLPTKNLSIVLVDASTNKFAGYQQETSHFPASVAKMFWLVALYGQINQGMWNNPKAFDPFITKMMRESDNDSSSFIVDRMTDTQSSQVNLNTEEFKTWIMKRKFYLNSYFQQAGYQSINVTQKTYPIPYLNLQEPKGNELQVRLDPNHLTKKPIRNQVSAIDAARLMYEVCHSKQSVNQKSSERICGFLKRDIKPTSWRSIKKEDFNPIETFFGEYLPSKNTELFSKAGWTPSSRQEVAMIRMLDRHKEYILAVFAEDPQYGKSKNIFPEISKLTYQRLHSKK